MLYWRRLDADFKAFERCCAWQRAGAQRTLESQRTLAAARLMTPNALTTGSGMRSRGPPILKFMIERCVWAPQYLQRAQRVQQLVGALHMH